MFQNLNFYRDEKYWNRTPVFPFRSTKSIFLALVFPFSICQIQQHGKVHSTFTVIVSFADLVIVFFSRFSHTILSVALFNKFCCVVTQLVCVWDMVKSSGREKKPQIILHEVSRSFSTPFPCYASLLQDSILITRNEISVNRCCTAITHLSRV